ncbi:hypothetical protein SUGI_0018760 [Cryptomeria japonica]|uniref:G-type lectin S-receptor-like serine/threonine-protein kinase LECRK3 n=1 Tax=Cryptomeria japonica TaxID=3369 RepID=UPI002408B4F0|nr:G-type lectin S-receptor-like serine/threonine-protein kinase LECRK3 [Cryptomeria japonica]GLJ05470.1 hypothetical protein SUGI_0018760 [Cryptomeria japonica]
MAPIQIHSFIFLLIQILFCASAQKQQNITLGSTLSPSQNSKWVSSNGQFAFGLYPLTPTLYVVGVWFDSVIPKTLAWTVLKENKHIPVGKKSSLQLKENGLRLNDDRKNVLWSSESSDIATAVMLDNGNFVLLNAFFDIIWQSFEYPTDTLLPGQTLKSNSNLFSKASTTNFSAGRFELSMQTDGNLVLYAVERRGTPEGAYWDNGQLMQLVSLEFDPSGLLYLVNSTNMNVSKVAEGKAGDGRFLRRVTLEIDGTLAQYVWNMDVNNSSWSSVWQPLKDPCKDVKGQCGNNGICRLTDQNKPDCICPPQFNFIDRQDHFKGCMRSSSPGQTCSTKRTMSRLDNTNWLRGVDTDSDYSVMLDLSEIECQQSCLNDCMCVVVTYDNAVRRKKRLPLSDGRQALEITTKAFVKVSDSFNTDSALPPLTEQRRERKGKTLVVIGITLLGCSSSLLVAAFLVTWLCGSKLRPGKGKITQKHKVVEGLKAFSFKEMEAATAGFRQELGRGAFGKVYKGQLPDGRAIAVKNLLENVTQEEHGEREFRTEMSVIGTSHHKNLVQLYGFCDEGSHRLLVYEYMSNGSLDTALFVDSAFLEWRTRVKIAMGIARGLLYLHEECKTQILHCDIKPQNILLDQNYSPKISDFGLAKLLKADQTATLTAARGTKGYIAPEWINKMPITVKVDVYSFGVMLLEIVCCRKTMDLGAPENKILLSDWVYECLKHGRLSELVEQQQVEGEGSRIDSRQLERMVLVGLWCIQEDPALRPYIKKVVQMMEGTVEIAVPPAPGSFVGSLSL